MTNTRKSTKAIATVMAVVIAISALFVIASVSASAKTTGLPASTTKINSFAKSYVFKATGKTSYGYDWTYKTDNNNVKVTCKYNFTAHQYKFTVTGKSYGLNHLTIKYKTADKKWASEKMTIFVDSENYVMRTA